MGPRVAIATAAGAGGGALMGGGAGAAAADRTTAAGALADASTGAIATFADGVGGAAFDVVKGVCGSRAARCGVCGASSVMGPDNCRGVNCTRSVMFNWLVLHYPNMVTFWLKVAFIIWLALNVFLSHVTCVALGAASCFFNFTTAVCNHKLCSKIFLITCFHNFFFPIFHWNFFPAFTILPGRVPGHGSSCNLTTEFVHSALAVVVDHSRTLQQISGSIG